MDRGLSGLDGCHDLGGNVHIEWQPPLTEYFHPLFTINSAIKCNVLGVESFVYSRGLICNQITELSSSSFYVFTVLAVLQYQYSFNLCKKSSLSDSSHHAGRQWDVSLGLGERNGTSVPVEEKGEKDALPPSSLFSAGEPSHSHLSICHMVIQR